MAIFIPDHKMIPVHSIVPASGEIRMAGLGAEKHFDDYDDASTYATYSSGTPTTSLKDLAEGGNSGGMPTPTEN